MADVAPLLADLAPRIRVEREVLWADGRGLDAPRLAERLLERLADLGVTARAGVAAVPIAAELAARWGDPSRHDEGPTPFLVKERTGWGWRRKPSPASPSEPGPAATPDVGDGGNSGTPTSPTSLGKGGGGAGTPRRRGDGAAGSLGKGGGGEGTSSRGGEAAAGPVGRGGGEVVVPAGEERAWLARFPVAVLEPPGRLRTLLEGVGVRTLGTLAALERESVEVRLGAPAVDLWRLARADDRRLLFDRIPPERPHGSMDFVDYVLTDPSRLLFTANALLGPLCDGLMGRGEHARTLRFTLPLANGETWARTIRPARPTASRETWLRLIRELLDRLTVPDAVAGMAIEVGATEEAAVRQGDLFDRGFATAAAVEAAVARLAERQVHPLTPDPTAHPLVERRGRWTTPQPSHSPPPSAAGGAAPGKAAVDPATRVRREAGPPSSGGGGEGGRLALQLLEAPRRVRVETAIRRDHEVPVRVRDRRGWREVVVAAGPDRISGGQWEASSYAREYYRCVTDEGVPLWIYRDGLDGGWYLHGWWD